MPRAVRPLFAVIAAVLLAAVITLGVKGTGDDGEPSVDDNGTAQPTTSPTASPTATASPAPTTSPTPTATESPDGATGGTTTGGTTTGGTTTGGTTTGAEPDDMPDTGGGAAAVTAGLIALGGAAGLARRR